MAIKETKIKDVLQELGLPESSEFCGYVVHLPKEDEFLAIVRESAAMIQRGFSKSPETAKIYQNHKKAMSDAKHCKQEAIVCLLFDTGNQLVIAPIGDTKIFVSKKIFIKVRNAHIGFPSPILAEEDTVYILHARHGHSG